VRHESPLTTADAVALLHKAKGRVHVLAGGSDLLVRMHGGYIEPDVIVDIKRIKAMHILKKTADGFLVGAAVSCAQLGRHAAIGKAWPGVVEAAQLIGSDQIQNRCTMVGNLCNASPAADSVPALIAANAIAIVQGPRGERRVPVEKIATAPGKTSLKKGEVVEALLLPLRPRRSGDAYLRFIPRSEMDIAVVSAGVSLTLGNKGVIEQAQVSLGAVAATVLRVKAGAKALIGRALDADALERLEVAVEEACSPISDKRGTADFRIKVVKVLAKRATKTAYQRAGGK